MSIGMVLTELFDDGGTLNIVLSDVIVAFMAIAFEQKENKRICIERLKREASGDPISVALLEQATTSNAVPISENLIAILNMAFARDIEAGMAATRATPSHFLDTATEDNKQQEEDRENTFIFVKGTQSGDGEKFSIRELLSPGVGIDRYTIAEGARFLRYSIAINTAKGYIFNNLSTNCCKLTYSRCCGRQTTEGIIVGGDSVGLHEAALMKVIGK